MAHFAKLNEQNIVTQVIVVHNNELLDENNQESEAKGVSFCQSLFGGTWKQTSYNKTFRKNFAGIGFTYDQQRDAFIPIKPHPSWILNELTCNWEAPVPLPEDAGVGSPPKLYKWDEETTSWKQVNFGG